MMQHGLTWAEYRLATFRAFVRVARVLTRCEHRLELIPDSSPLVRYRVQHGTNPEAVIVEPDFADMVAWLRATHAYDEVDAEGDE